MPMPALVLVHGGGLAADSWDLIIEELRKLAPELTVLALDMPGRRNKPDDLRSMTVADYVDSLVDDIEGAGLTDLVLVAHSMGGLPVPGVAAKLGAERVRELIFCAAFLPPDGTSIVESSPWHIAAIARRRVKRNLPMPAPKAYARFVFMNGVPPGRRRFLDGKLYAESLRILAEKVSRRGMPEDIPRTWILTKRDRALAPRLQRKYVDSLGGVQTLIEVDTCHMIMVSEPRRLAEILIDRCRSYA